VAVPRAFIGAFTSTVTLLTTAIQSGVQNAIDIAIKELNGVSKQLFGGLGSAVQGIINVVGKSITQVQEAIQGEIDKVAGALADVTNNLFRLQVPNVNPCLNAILNGANLNNFELPSQVLSNPPQ
jgi:phage-related protein